MLTLTKATEETRAFIKWTIIIIASILSIILIFNIGKIVKEIFYPTPQAPPTVAYGILPAIEFPVQTQSTQITYTLNTLSGVFPTFPDRASVFPIAKPVPNLLTIQRARDRVQLLQFSGNGTKISDGIYSWTSDKPYFQQLIYNVFTENYTYTTDFLTSFDPSRTLTKSQTNNAQRVFMDFLTTFKSIPSDMDKSKTKITPLTVQNGSPVEVTSIASASIIRVDLYQQNLNDFPIVYPHPPQSTTYGLVGILNGLHVLNMNYVHQAPSQESATYPIKTAEKAFADLKKGKGYIASHQDDATQIGITEVSLAYYASDNDQKFLQPVFVFQGPNEFRAYVPAVTDAWVGK